MNKVSIIIPNFNGASYLQACCLSIYENTQISFEVIIVDNGSTDHSVDWCRKEDVTLISLPRNAGFPAACNIGLRAASGDALLLLNNDTLVTPNWLFKMMNCLYSEEKIGIVGPMSNFVSGEQQIQFPFTNIEDMNRLFEAPDRKKWKSVERIVGFCFLFKREVLEKVGELDERFSPGHFEDDDYCYRARQAGYQLMIAGDVFVFHHGSASFSLQDDDHVKSLIEINRRKFIDKWGNHPEAYM